MYGLGMLVLTDPWDNHCIPKPVPYCTHSGMWLCVCVCVCEAQAKLIHKMSIIGFTGLLVYCCGIQFAYVECEDVCYCIVSLL